MTIDVVDGWHLYALEYRLPEPAPTDDPSI